METNLLHIPIAPGDIFLVDCRGPIGYGIGLFECIYGGDFRAKYKHAGIIATRKGLTYECLWKVTSQDFFLGYQTSEVLIARNYYMHEQNAIKMLGYLGDEHHDDFYPIYRLIFHMFPGLNKIATNKVVCSEFVAKGLWHLDLFTHYNGVTPDYLHEHFCNCFEKWDVVFEGRLPKVEMKGGEVN